MLLNCINECLLIKFFNIYEQYLEIEVLRAKDLINISIRFASDQTIIHCRPLKFGKTFTKILPGPRNY